MRIYEVEGGWGGTHKRADCDVMRVQGDSTSRLPNHARRSQLFTLCHRRNMCRCLLLSLKSNRVLLAQCILPLVKPSALGQCIDYLVGSDIKRDDRERLRLLGGMMKR